MLFLPSVAHCPELSQCSGQAGSSPGRCDWERGVHIVKFTVCELLIRVNSRSCGHCVSLSIESVTVGFHRLLVNNWIDLLDQWPRIYRRVCVVTELNSLWNESINGATLLPDSMLSLPSLRNPPRPHQMPSSQSPG